MKTNVEKVVLLICFELRELVVGVLPLKFQLAAKKSDWQQYLSLSFFSCLGNVGHQGSNNHACCCPPFSHLKCQSKK